MLRASFQNSNTTDKFGIPNFKAVVAASPVSNRASQQSKYTPTKSPASDWSPVKFLPVCSPDVQGLTRNTTASQTPLGKNTPVKKSAGFTSPVKKGQQALGGQKPAEEDYMSAVWKKMVEKNQADCPDQAQIPNVIEYLHLEPRSPGKSPVRKNVVANRVKSPPKYVNDRSGGLKGQKLGQYAGKESIDDLVRASKVTESGSTKSLRDMVEKAKLTSKEEDSDVNVVEKYIGKTKGKESPYKTPRHRDEGFSKNYGLFTPENYMGASRTQTEASNHESVLYTDRQSASKGVLDLSVSRSKVNDPGYSRVNRPSYDETVWTSPRRSQLVEIGNSPKGEKRVEVVLRDGVEKYKQALATSMENFGKMEEELAKKQARKYVEKHVEEQASEVEKQIEEGDKETEQEQEQKQEQEKEKENRCEEEEEEEEEEEKEENKDNEKEKEEENGCGENCEEEEEVQELKEETLVEDKEEFARTVEREVEFAREPEREQRKKQAYPQHVVERHEIFSIPENEKAEQESSQSEEAEQHNGEEISEEQREKKEEVTSDGVKSTKGSQEIVSNVMETPTGTGDDLTRQPESETQNDTTEEDIAENVLTVYQEKMAKVETWKKLGDQENQISLLKEVIQDLEDYEAGHVKGHAEEERKNVITHKIYAHNRLAAEFYEAGEYEKALQSCRKVAEIDSTNLQALNKACQIHTKLGNTEKSKDIMKRIRKLMQTPMILQYNQQFLLGEIAMNSQTGSQGASSQGDMLASKLSFFNH